MPPVQILIALSITAIISNGFLDALELGDHVTFVIHDWGSALGFDWANRNQDRIAGIAYMEAIVRPVTWEEWPEVATPIFQSFRSPAGEEMVIEKTFSLKPYYLYPFFENYQTMRWLNIDAHFREAEHGSSTLT